MSFGDKWQNRVGLDIYIDTSCKDALVPSKLSTLSIPNP